MAPSDKKRDTVKTGTPARRGEVKKASRGTPLLESSSSARDAEMKAEATPKPKTGAGEMGLATETAGAAVAEPVAGLPQADSRKAAASRSRKRRAAISQEERRRMIAEAAYYKAERRGFKGGDPRQDWQEAEAEVDLLLMHGEGEGR